MGRGDKRTRRGKIAAGSNGNVRLRKKRVLAAKKKASAKKITKK